MNLRNGAHGYGAVTKTLHWLTVGLVTAQFVVGYLMDDDGGGRGRGRGRGGESGRGRGRGGAEEAIDLLPPHVTLSERDRRFLLALHVIAHIAFFVAVAAHVGFVVSRRLVGRMLPARR